MPLLNIVLLVALAVFLLAWLVVFIPFAMDTRRMGKQIREMKREEAKRKAAQ